MGGRLAIIAGALAPILMSQVSWTQQEPQSGSTCDIAYLASLPAEPDGALRLLACPLKERVPVGDAVQVLVLLQNIGSAHVLVRARLILEAYLVVDVTGPDGRSAPLSSWEPGEIGKLADVVLPRGGLIGRIVGLGCEVGDFGVADVTPDQCDPLFHFDQEGLYRVSIRYVMWCAFPPCPADYPWTGELQAPVFEIEVYAPKDTG